MYVVVYPMFNYVQPCNVSCTCIMIKLCRYLFRVCVGVGGEGRGERETLS